MFFREEGGDRFSAVGEGVEIFPNCGVVSIDDLIFRLAVKDDEFGDEVEHGWIGDVDAGDVVFGAGVLLDEF